MSHNLSKELRGIRVCGMKSFVQIEILCIPIGLRFNL